MQSSLIEVNFIGGLRELGQASWPSRFFFIAQICVEPFIENRAYPDTKRSI